MKKVNIKISILAVFALLVCSCEVDNYDEPSETLTGTLIDAVTGEPMQTYFNNTRIQLLMTSWSDDVTPMYFTVKPDGTFSNTKVFAGTYTVKPVEGPFYPVEGKSMEIKGSCSVDFEVVPYLNVSIEEITRNGTSVTVKFKVTSEREEYDLVDARVFLNNTVLVSSEASISSFTHVTDRAGVDYATLESTTYTVTIDELKSGRTYYLRVGARVDTGAKHFNYSQIKEVVIP